MAILTMLVLFEAWAVPRLGESLSIVPPWRLMTDTGSLTFAAGVAFGVLLLVTAIPMPYIVRCALLTVCGLGLYGVALVHTRIEVAAFAFRGHPAIGATLAGSPGLVALFSLALLLPAALYWRSRYTESFAARVAVLVGILLSLAAYLLAGVFDVPGGPPLTSLPAMATGAPLVGDKIAASLLLLPAAATVLALLALLPHPKTGGSAFWAWLFVTGVGAAVLVQAGFVSGWRDGQWKAVLAPMEIGLMLYAGLLLLPVALGHLLGEAEALSRK
jgi:hypothetical protein